MKKKIFQRYQSHETIETLNRMKIYEKINYMICLISISCLCCFTDLEMKQLDVLKMTIPVFNLWLGEIRKDEENLPDDQ